jgi:hypothetical protein
MVSYFLGFSHRINQSKVGEDIFEKEKKGKYEKNTEKERCYGKTGRPELDLYG